MDNTVAYYLNITTSFSGYPPYCAAFRQGERHLTYISCSRHLKASYLCEVKKPEQTSSLHRGTISPFPFPSASVLDHAHMSPCGKKGSTYSFLQCDRLTQCYGATLEEMQVCLERRQDVNETSFTCANGQVVHYSLVCDHRLDCDDGSDEDFCRFLPCLDGQFLCVASRECLPPEAVCDGEYHCVDKSDEKSCWVSKTLSEWETVAPPAIIDFRSPGNITFVDVDISLNGSVCPETHFQCPGGGYCLPVYLRCNGVWDCPGREDEAECISHSCPGYYRCRGEYICLHADHLCDGLFQCPRHDDELLCDLKCPLFCICHGFAFICLYAFPASRYPQLRYLNADNLEMSFQNFANNHLLIYLTLRDCGIKEIGRVNLPNLQTLYLDFNDIRTITSEEFSTMKNLRRLSLAFNKLLSLQAMDFSNLTFPYLHFLDLSGGSTTEITNTSFLPFPNVQHLKFYKSKLRRVLEPGFNRLHKLQILDVSECPETEFYGEMFKGLSRLRTIYASKFQMCCPAVLPENFDPDHCHAPSDDVSSCEALLRADVFRAFLVMYALFALLGNFVSFVYRVFGKGVTKQLGFDIFVTHLCVADFLMGVYLAIVGIADRIYYGTYEWNSSQWKQSVACQIAGFLSLLSSEVSAFLICFITLERFLLIRFPHRNLRFTPKSALIACIVGWVVGVLFAATPFFPFSPPWDFYGQTGICIPLPITRKVFPGSEYSFYLMIVCNFVLFLLIAAGQLLIFWSIRSQTKLVSSSSKKAKDMAIARRLLAVVMSDFLCWFPIGLLGLMARSGVPISGDVNVAMAIFILPFNSALNPFLYTLHTLLERHRAARAQRQSEKLSETASRLCPNCAKREQDLSLNTASVMISGPPDRVTITEVTDQEILILIEAFLKEHLTTPEYFHLKDHVVEVISRGNSSSPIGGQKSLADPIPLKADTGCMLGIFVFPQPTER
ncbi:hypothetical protein ACOMHN_056736 [Nucella lapillus]